VEFIEAPLFTQLLPEYLTDDEYADLQLYLASDPEAGARLLKAAVDEEKRQRARRPLPRRK
jgi:hypothetical protein